VEEAVDKDGANRACDCGHCSLLISCASQEGCCICCVKRIRLSRHPPIVSRLLLPRVSAIPAFVRSARGRPLPALRNGQGTCQMPTAWGFFEAMTGLLPPGAGQEAALFQVTIYHAPLAVFQQGVAGLRPGKRQRYSTY